MKKIITFSSAALTALSLVAIVAPAFADTGAVTPLVSSTQSTTGVKFKAPENALALDGATNFYFGEHQIDGSKTEFQASTETDSSKSNSQASPLVTFHDLDGESKNYKISATASGLSDLKNSIIELGAATFSDASGANVTDTSLFKNLSTSSHVLNTQPQDIFESTGAANGYYTAKFSDAKLIVPVADQTKDNHEGIITWDLKLVP